MNKIINILKERKSIPLDKFIDISLYDKKYGYYMKKNPIGKKNDFITSPLISNLFGEMIAIWCVSFWEHLGKPSKIIIVEMGPGDGSLCSDLLIALKNFKNFFSCLEIKLLEKSNKLKKIQKIKIRNKKVQWIEKINDIKSGPIIFIGNEFFDALPIKQVYKKRKKFFEKYVTFSKFNKKLQFLYKKANKKLILDIKKHNLISNDGVIEYPIEAIEYLKIISKKLKKYNGGLLSFDYGYLNKKNQDTLQSVQKHNYVDVLSNPGNTDITSHINYKLFSKFLIKNNLLVEKIVNQNEFLQKLGIVERANQFSKNKNFKKKAEIYYRLKRLLNYGEMGNLFKVLFAKKKSKRFSLGF